LLPFTPAGVAADKAIHSKARHFKKDRNSRAQDKEGARRRILGQTTCVSLNYKPFA
jgi:hypothetical protein